MNQMWNFRETEIHDVIEVTPFNADDIRGCFTKDYSRDVFEHNGIEHDLAEVFYTTSHKGVIRALHFQRVKQQPKLVRCIWGHVYDVAVDLRPGSETFGKWAGFYLTAENHQLLYIPKGFAHGFLALEDDTLFSYLCGDRYDPESDGGICWDDPQLAVSWPLDRVEQTIISEKDAALPTLAEYRASM